MLCRERRSWTAKEDELLRAAVQREDPENPNPSKWHAIAKHVPNRTNKDCRKRWFAKMASDVVKGGWAPDEDEKLVKGIERYGTRWSLVASVVQTRNSDQCAKRWTDTLNPAIDRTTWSPEADELLLQAVNEHGKVWTKIVKTYFPGRTGLSAKNRYNSITRFSAESSRGTRPRRKSPEDRRYSVDMKLESMSSSSSSSSASPVTPSMSLPGMPHSPYPSSLDNNMPFFESLSGWTSSSSNASDDMSFSPSPTGFEAGCLSLPVTPSTDMPDSFHVFELSMNQTLSSFPEEAHIGYPENSSMQLLEQSNFSPASGELYQPYTQFPNVYGGNDMANQFAMFDALPSQVDPLLGMNWENANRPVDPKHFNGYKVQQPNNFSQYMF